jgi:adenosylcobinamide-phosphate synthase
MSFSYYPILTNGHLVLHSTVFAVIAAILLDRLLGEPKHWHPLVGFGWLVNQIECRLNKKFSPIMARLAGLLAWLMLLTPFVFTSQLVTRSQLGWLVNIALLYFAIGAHSLIQHAERIAIPLSQHNLIDARHAVSMIVSRDTSQLNETEVARASVESVLENGNDAIFGAIFWFLLLGGTGALIFRLANTLDAMWGYRTPRFLYFGWAAARLDDLLNLIPARLTALTYALCGHTASAIRCWHLQARTWYSPNAGPVMSAGAGALKVKLGGAAVYHGTTKERPPLGLGATANVTHILAATRLIKCSMILWCAVILLIQILWGMYFA